MHRKVEKIASRRSKVGDQTSSEMLLLAAVKSKVRMAVSQRMLRRMSWPQTLARMVLAHSRVQPCSSRMIAASFQTMDLSGYHKQLRPPTGSLVVRMERMHTDVIIICLRRLHRFNNSRQSSRRRPCSHHIRPSLKVTKTTVLE